MGYDFTNSSGSDFQFSATAWAIAVTIAEDNGWAPSGTLAPEDWDEPDPWTGDYDGNEGQRVSASDASALADALDKAAADANLETDLTEFESLFDEPITPTIVTQFRDDLRKFASFCRKGEFVIE